MQTRTRLRRVRWWVVFTGIGIGLAGLSGVLGIEELSSINSISGHAFLDYNNDQIEEGADFRHPVLRVNVYDDADGNGTLSSGDLVLGAGFTNSEGNYKITIDGSGSFSRRVQHENDDAEEDRSDSSMYLGSSDLEMVYDGSTHQLIGIRIDSFIVPPAATITTAFIRFTAKGGSPSTDTLVIKAEKSLNSQRFTSDNGNISTRTLTSDSVKWGPTAWTNNNNYDSPDIGVLINEVLQQEGWYPGRAMSFVVSGPSGTKRAYTGTTDGPQLIVNYTMPVTDYVVGIDTQYVAGHSQVAYTSLVQGGATGVAVSYYGPPSLCIAVADNSHPTEDRLHYMNPINGYTSFNANSAGTQLIEAIANDFQDFRVWAVNEDTLGKLDLRTGIFEAGSDTLGVGNGAAGTIGLDDADGLDFHPYTGELWATHRRSGNDVLFRIDTATYKYVPDAFGSGTDYVLISGTGILPDVDGIAFNPYDGKLYGVNNQQDSVVNQLIEINLNDGSATVIDTITYGIEPLEDVEGISFSPDGTLYIVTGNGGPSETDDALYRLDVNTAAATRIGPFRENEDFESCGCMITVQNALSGLVFEDINKNGVQNTGEGALSNVKVRLYRDFDGSGSINGGDFLVDSFLTNGAGGFDYQMMGFYDFILEIDTFTLPPNYSLTTSQIALAAFSDGFGNMADEDNVFGAYDFNLPVEWLGFEANWLGEDAKLSWQTARETNNDYFQIERSVDGDQFQAIGRVPGAGNSTEIEDYQYVDQAVIKLGSERLYYRLRQVDIDGKFDLSPMVQLSRNQADLGYFHCYPNPADERVMINFVARDPNWYELQVSDLAGRNVLQQSWRSIAGHQIKTVEVSHWTPGIYLFQLSGEGQTFQEKIVVR